MMSRASQLMCGRWQRSKCVPRLVLGFDACSSFSVGCVVCYAFFVVDDVSTLAQVVSKQYLLARLSL